MSFLSRLLIVFLVLGILLRIVVFSEVKEGPLTQHQQWAESDMHFFEHWAKQVAQGDWWTDQALHPFHHWNQLVADIFIQHHSEAFAAARLEWQASDVELEPAKALWRYWYGHKQFHQEPVYSYGIAVLYKMFGPNPLWVFVGQMGLGVGNLLLMIVLAYRFFGRWAAVFAGVLALLYGPFIFYEVIMLRATLIIFVGLGLLLLTDSVVKRGQSKGYFVLGIAMGLACLVKTTFLLWAGVIGMIMIYEYRSRWPLFLRYGLIGIAGGIIGLSPGIVRNVVVGVPPLTFSSVNAISFIKFMDRSYEPGQYKFQGQEIAKTLAVSQGRVIPSMQETLKTHSFSSFVSLVWNKFKFIWFWYEYPNNANFYYFRQFSQVLQGMFLSFAIIAPLGLIGIGLSFRDVRSRISILLFVGMNIGLILLSAEAARYRLPLVAIMIPFAGLAIAQLIEWLRAQQWIRAGFVFFVFGGLSLWMLRPLPDGVSLIRSADYVAAFQTTYLPRYTNAAKENDWESASKILKKSFQVYPEQFTPQLANFYASIHYTYSQTLDELGLPDDAQRERETAIELKKKAK